MAYDHYMRTPEQFIDDMLERGRHWTAILSVARVIRGGSWAAKVKGILRDRKIVPGDDEKLNAARDKMLKEDVRRQQDREKREKRERHRRRKKK